MKVGGVRRRLDRFNARKDGRVAVVMARVGRGRVESVLAEPQRRQAPGRVRVKQQVLPPHGKPNSQGNNEPPTHPRNSLHGLGSLFFSSSASERPLSLSAPVPHFSPCACARHTRRTPPPPTVARGRRSPAAARSSLRFASNWR